MRFAFFSAEGTSLSYQARLRDEGEDVLVYIAPEQQRRNGEGIIPQTNSYQALVEWAMEKPSVVIFDGNGHGKKADELRKRGLLVVGGGSFCDALESDREWSEKLAGSLGMKLPETKAFATISDTQAWIRKNGDDGRTWVFKSNKYLDASSTYVSSSQDNLVRYLQYLKGKWGDRISNIVQEGIDGVDLSTAGWWNGKCFLTPLEGTIENKKLMDGGVGPSTGCSLNLIWMYQDTPKIAKELNWDGIEQMFRRLNAPPGLYDVNARIDKKDKKPYFLEWTPRFGYDSEPTAQMGLTMPLGEFFYRLAKGGLDEAPFTTDEAMMSVRLSVPPYPWETLEDIPKKKTCVGLPVIGADGLWAEGRDEHFIGYGLGVIDGELSAVDPTGLIGLSGTRGTNLAEMGDDVYCFIKDNLQIPNLAYRTDAVKKITEDLQDLKDLGYEATAALDWGAKEKVAA